MQVNVGSVVRSSEGVYAAGLAEAGRRQAMMGQFEAAARRVRLRRSRAALVLLTISSVGLVSGSAALASHAPEAKGTGGRAAFDARHDSSPRKLADVNTTITAGGPSVSVTISTAGDNARLAFGGSAGQRVSVKFTSNSIGGSGSCRTKASILKPDGSPLTGTICVGTGSTGGFIDTTTLPSAGTYTVFIDPQSSYTGSITTTLYDVPSDPTPALAFTSAGTAYTFTSTTPGQNARPTFDGAEGDRVFVKLSSHSFGNGCLDTVRVWLLNPGGANLTSPKSLCTGSGGGYIDTTSLPTAGTYTLVIDPSSANTGTITATVYKVPPDEASTLTPTANGSAYTFATATPGQNARAAFAGTVGQRIFVDFSSHTFGSGCVGTVKVWIEQTGGTSSLARRSSVRAAATSTRSTR
jgi:hypothetical protein